MPYDQIYMKEKRPDLHECSEDIWINRWGGRWLILPVNICGQLCKVWTSLWNTPFISVCSQQHVLLPKDLLHHLGETVKQRCWGSCCASPVNVIDIKEHWLVGWTFEYSLSSPAHAHTTQIKIGLSGWLAGHLRAVYHILLWILE